MLVEVTKIDEKEISVDLDMVPVAREFISNLDTDELDYRVVMASIFVVLYNGKTRPVTEDTIEDILDVIAEISAIEIYTDNHSKLIEAVKKVWQSIRSIDIRYTSTVWSLDYIDVNKGTLYLKR